MNKKSGKQESVIAMNLEYSVSGYIFTSACVQKYVQIKRKEWLVGAKH